MKIVQAVTLASEDGAFGGPLAVAIAQSQELARRGHQVTLLAAWDGKFELKVPGVRVVLSRGRRIPRLGFSGIRAPALVAWLRRNRCEVDLVHVHAGRHAFDLEMAAEARRLQIPYVLQTHGMVMPTSNPLGLLLDRLLTRPLLRAAEAVLVLTDAESAGMRGVEAAARVAVVHNGLAPVDRPLDEQSGPKEVLFLARLHPRKRVLAFAAMAKLLSERGVAARFSVVGPDEGDLAQLERFCMENPAVPLRYEGPVSPGEGAARLTRAAVYVLPSRGEVFPVAVLEALAAGTAVVLTQDCGIAGRLDRANAASVSDGSATDLAAKVEELLEDDAFLAARRQNGRNLVEGELGSVSMVDEIEQRYVAALKRKHLPTVVWLTNQAAPYRIPVWNALAKQVNLEVWLLESDRRLHRDRNNRGTDWEVGGREFAFSVRVLPTVAIRRGEARHYIAGGLGRGSFRNVDSVLIGGWDSPAFWSAARNARRAGVRRVAFYESHRLTQRNVTGALASARRWFFRSVDGVVVPGVAAQEALHQEGIEPAKISVGFNAVDVERIHDETNHERQRRVRSVDHTLRLIVVGQLIERKNVGEAIRVLCEPELEHATLTVVGTGPLEAELARLVDELGLSARVNLIGYLPGTMLPKVFADHDVLLHPALEEVWGLVVNEALAAGLRVVVSDRCGVAPSVRGWEGVEIVEPRAAPMATAAKRLGMLAAIAEPQILRHGPESFAQVFVDALLPQLARADETSECEQGTAATARPLPVADKTSSGERS